MFEILDVLLYTVYYMLGAASAAFLIRAILSFVAPEADNPFVGLIVTITEFFVFPIRMICEKHDWFTSLPIDIPFFLGFLLIGALQLILTIFI